MRNLQHPDDLAQHNCLHYPRPQVLPGWVPVGSFVERICAIRPDSAHVSRALSVFVDYWRATLCNGFDG